jgi:hypothetical protein
MRITEFRQFLINVLHKGPRLLSHLSHQQDVLNHGRHAPATHPHAWPYMLEPRHTCARAHSNTRIDLTCDRIWAGCHTRHRVCAMSCATARSCCVTHMLLHTPHSLWSLALARKWAACRDSKATGADPGHLTTWVEARGWRHVGEREADQMRLCSAKAHGDGVCPPLALP